MAGYRFTALVCSGLVVCGVLAGCSGPSSSRSSSSSSASSAPGAVEQVSGMLSGGAASASEPGLAGLGIICIGFSRLVLRLGAIRVGDWPKFALSQKLGQAE